MIHLDLHSSADMNGDPLVIAETSTDGAGWRAAYTLNIEAAGGLEAAIKSALDNARTFLWGCRYAGADTRLTAYGADMPLYFGAEDEAAAIVDTLSRRRLEAATREAAGAFWTTLAAAYPEAASGDMAPDALAGFDQATREAGAAWVAANAPAAAPLGCAL